MELSIANQRDVTINLNLNGLRIIYLDLSDNKIQDFENLSTLSYLKKLSLKNTNLENK